MLQNRVVQSLPLDFFGAFRRDSNVKASIEITPAPVVASARAAAPNSKGSSYFPKA